MGELEGLPNGSFGSTTPWSSLSPALCAVSCTPGGGRQRTSGRCHRCRGDWVTCVVGSEAWHHSKCMLLERGVATHTPTRLSDARRAWNPQQRTETAPFEASAVSKGSMLNEGSTTAAA